MVRNKLEDDEIACPHCEAVYCLAGKSQHAVPYVCKNCGRMMYDGRRKLTRGRC